MYTIGQVSKLFHLPISTLRYYDKEGLFPSMERTSGIRKFGDRKIETLRLIECLKASGLEIREIRQFIEWCTEGPSTYEMRRQLLETRKAAIEKDISRLKGILDVLQYKCWYYETAGRNGGEEEIKAMLPDKLPPEIQKLYNRIHL